MRLWGWRRQGNERSKCWRSWDTRLWIRVRVRMGNIEVSRKVGKRGRHAKSWIHGTRMGKGAGPTGRKNIGHKRLSRGMRHGFDDTVGRVRGPGGVSAPGLGEIMKDSINITILGIDKVMF